MIGYSDYCSNFSIPAGVVNSPVAFRSSIFAINTSVAENLNKRWRFSLGKSVEDTVLHLLSELIMAKNAPKPLKAGYLIKACAHQETCMLKLRLCLELKLVNETKIFQTQATMEDVGRQIGGWLKSVQS